MERNTLTSASLFGTQRVGANVFSSPVSGFLSQLCCHVAAFTVGAEIEEHDSCSNLPSTSVINTITKAAWGAGKWFNLASSFQFITKGSQSRSSKQETGTEERPRQELCLLLAPHGFLCLLSYPPLSRTTCAGVAPCAVGWALHISHQSRKYRTVLPRGQSDGDVSSVEAPLPR